MKLTRANWTYRNNRGWVKTPFHFGDLLCVTAFDGDFGRSVVEWVRSAKIYGIKNDRVLYNGKTDDSIVVSAHPFYLVRGKSET